MFRKTKSAIDSIANALLGVVLIAFVTFSTMWAIRVPPFAPPDEIAHADYFFALLDAGHFYRVRQAIRGTDVMVQTKYIENTSGYRKIRYNPLGRVPQNYGNRQFYQKAYDEGPSLSRHDRDVGSRMPYAMFSYPATYYWILAMFVGTIDIFKHQSVYDSFFIARLMNVAFGLGTLLFAYSALRRSNINRKISILALIGIAMLPMFCWMSGYIQPDNLVILLVTAASWAASLRTRSKEIWLGLISSALISVKPHYGIALWIATSLFSASRISSEKRSFLKFMVLQIILPTVSLIGVIFLTPVGFSDISNFLKNGSAVGPTHRTASTLVLFGQAISNVYLGGTAFADYWLQYGSRGSYVPVFSRIAVLTGILVVTLGTLVVTIFVQIKIIFRIIFVAQRKKMQALRLVGLGFNVNLYLIYSSFLIVVYISSNGVVALQGRYWLALVLPTTLVVLHNVPRIFKRNKVREKISIYMISVVAIFVTLINTQTPAAIQNDFYEPTQSKVENNFGSFVVNLPGDITSFGSETQSFSKSETLTIRGYSVDVLTGLPANHVEIYLDKKFIKFAKVGLPRLPVASQYFDDALDKSGFEASVDTRLMTRGTHVLSVKVGRQNNNLPIRRQVTITIR